MERLRRIRQGLALPGSILLLGFLSISDGDRLYRSALWGTPDWLWAALAGLTVGMTGVIMAVRSSLRRRGGHGPDDRKHVVGLTYTVGMTLIFFLTHRKYGRPPEVDSPFMVAALTAQIVLAVLLAVLAILINTGFYRRDDPAEGTAISDDSLRPNPVQEVRRSRVLSSRRRRRGRPRP